MSRRLLVWLACLGLAGCGEPVRPDVLLVVVDTLRADQLGAYGFAAPVSPNLDALAARGVVFERALAAGTETAPSHASIMTSRWVGRHSIGNRNGWTRLDGEATLAEQLRAAGYATAAFVGNPMLQRRIGLDAGFEVYDDELSVPEANRPGYFERAAGPTTERAVAWLDAQGDRPVFLWVHYQDPHGPYIPPKPFAAAFPDLVHADEAPLPLLDDNSGRGGIPAYQRFGEERRPSEYTRRYAGEVAAFDAALGALLGAFERRGRPRVIALTADHGESFGENERWFVHGEVTTPELARIPFVLAAPGLSPARRSELVHHVDVMPTLLELARVAAPGDLDGVALGPYLRDGAPLPERTLFCDAARDIAAYRGDRLFRFWIPFGGAAGAGARQGTFRWQPGELPRPARNDPSLARELKAYHESRKPVRLYAEELSPEEVARLRALGYVVPEQDLQEGREGH